MGGHYRIQFLSQHLKWNQILRGNRSQTAFVASNIMVRIRPEIAMPRKRLAAIGHSRLAQAAHQRACERGNDMRLAMKGTIANDTAFSPIEVEHRRETEVDAVGCQFRPHYVSTIQRRFQRIRFAALPEFAEGAHRRNGGKTPTKTLPSSTPRIPRKQQTPFPQ